MSRFFNDYNQYLGSQRCCNLNTQGPVGPQGPTGPALIGPRGNTGPTGASFTGPTGRGCRGDTGPAGSFPVPTSTSGTAGVVSYNGGKYYYDSTKTFVINHPNNSAKLLVHGCLEGPEAGVYYRGKDEIINNEYVEVTLPHYVADLAKDFTVQITPIYSGKIVILNSSEVEQNKFRVYGTNTKFHWLVHGKRRDIDVEPDKDTVDVKGSGPYLYI
jgi:hypothetical protein